MPPHDDKTLLRESAGAPAKSAATVGSVLDGRYRLDRKLGEGGMGVVYLASDLRVQGELFAVKILSESLRDHPDALALLRAEVRQTRSLAHPNIVGVYSLNSDPLGIYMLMEYLEGKSLDGLLGEEFGRGMPFNRAWPIIQEMAAALAYAHDRNIVHSDLKPSNVFITVSGRAKLLDFGIARAPRRRAAEFDAGTLGALTPGYASCEMLEGAAPDARDDIYSFACLIHELLSGKHPFGGRSALEARAQGLTLQRPRGLTARQTSALAKGCSFERASRTQSIEALVQGLAPSRRARPVMIAVAVLVVTCLCLAGWWLASDRAPLPPAAVVESRHAAARVVSPSRPPDQPDTRTTRIGSEPQEIEWTLDLCRQTGTACSADDFADEAARTVVLQPFVIDATEVTNRDFARFTAATDHVTSGERAHGLYAVVGSAAVFRRNQSWRSLSKLAVGATDGSDYPVRGIDFDSARQYCAWANSRLPSEAEWEFAARGVERRMFPAGVEVGDGGSAPARHLLPVADQPGSGPFGARGMGGSLWEWVDGGTPEERVLRGASWLETNRVHLRLATRRLEAPDRGFTDTGFRCARSVQDWPDR